MSDEETVISMNKERTLMQMLDQWLRDLVFPGQVKDFIEEHNGSGDDSETMRKLSLYTNEHEYIITAIERFNGEKSYLGCGVLARKARAAEDWHRGNDLPDGDFTQDTWNKILNAILNYELIKLSTYQKPDSIPDDTIA